MSKGAEYMLRMLPLKQVSLHNSKVAKCHFGPSVVVGQYKTLQS